MFDKLKIILNVLKVMYEYPLHAYVCVCMYGVCMVYVWCMCMQEDDIVDRILKRYLPLIGLEVYPPALLTNVCMYAYVCMFVYMYICMNMYVCICHMLYLPCSYRCWDSISWLDGSLT